MRRRLRAARHRVRNASRSRWVLVGLAALGLALSWFGALRDAGQAGAFERLRFTQAVSTHQAELQAHLAARETLMEAVAALFNPGEPIRPEALRPYGRNFLTLSPDVTAVAWAPAVPRERREDALAAIRASGVESPVLFGRERRPLDPDLAFTPHVILDVEPRDSNASVLLGGSPSDWPERRSAIELARSTRRVATPGATRLFQPPNPFAFLLYAPVFSERGGYLGALSFSYRVESLFLAPTLRPTAGPNPFTVHVYDTALPGQRVHLASVGPDGLEAPTLPFAEALGLSGIQYRSVQFGGLSLTLAYVPEASLGAGLRARFLLFAGVGLGLTLAVVLTVLQVQGTARRLAREVAARRSAEARLHVLIQELNHRVRNVLTVAQAIVTRSLRPGLPLAEVRETVIGRYQALATVMSLLTQTDWKGASLRELLDAELLPYAGRARVHGPDLFLRPRAAQTLTLVLHELVTNSAKYGALSGGTGQSAGQVTGQGAGHVEVAWSLDRLPDDPRFRLDWREVGGPPVTAPERRGFGSQILERVAPQDLAAQASLAYEAEGLVYRLDAPLHEVVEEDCSRSGSAPEDGARAA